MFISIIKIPSKPQLQSQPCYTITSTMGVSSSAEDRQEEDWPYVTVIRDPDYLDWRLRIVETEKETVQDIQKKQAELPVQISDTVFLSDAKGASKIDRLKELGITHVLNVAGKEASLVSEELYHEAGITLKVVTAQDEEGYPMLVKHLSESREFIASARDKGGRCVVHCVAGINRSGVIVAAEKMLTERLNVLDTVAHCRRQRGNIHLCNNSFQEQLVALARKEGLLGPKPGEPGCTVSTPSTPMEAKPPKPSIRSLF